MGVSADASKAITNWAAVQDEGLKPHHNPSIFEEFAGRCGSHGQVTQF